MLKIFSGIKTCTCDFAIFTHIPSKYMYYDKAPYEYFIGKNWIKDIKTLEYDYLRLFVPAVSGAWTYNMHRRHAFMMGRFIG